MFADFHSEIFSWIRGALLLLFIGISTVYFQNQKKLFLYYSLYVFFIFIYFLNPVSPSFFQPFFDYLNFSLLYFSFVFYIDFARLLVSTKEKLPKWDRLFVLEKRVLIIFSVLLPFVKVGFGDRAYLGTTFIFSILITVFSAFAYCAIWKIKYKQVKFFVLGSLSFLILSNASNFSKLIFGHEYLISKGFEPMLLTYIGVFIELFVFIIILGQIFMEIEQKKNQLKLEVAIKQRESAELKMTALQSQMNPHFLFNSLNSINNFVIKKNKEEASEFITSFSKLIRNILSNSERSYITVMEELKLLHMYVSLEQTRMNDSFGYVQKIEKDLQLDKILIPPLFLQPYIENCIWHGFVKQQTDYKIELTIRKQVDFLLIEIRDNGVGLKNYQKCKKNILSKKIFSSTVASEKRIKLLYGFEQVDIQIIDLITIGKTGTLVNILLPLKVNLA